MSTGSKKPKDKNAPKRPQSAYFLFSNKRRKELSATNPDKKITEISKIIAAEWYKMDDAAKKPLEAEAKELKAKYEKDIEKYKKTKQFDEYEQKLQEWKQSEGTSKSNKRMKDPNAPKKTQSGYFLFTADRRPKLKELHPDKKMTEIAKLLGAEWKEMSPAQKKPWEDKANSLKAEYQKKFDEYKETDDYKSFQEKVQKVKLQQKQNVKGKKKKEESSSDEEEEEEKKPRKKATKSKNSKSKKKKESGSESDSTSSGSSGSTSDGE